MRVRPRIRQQGLSLAELLLGLALTALIMLPLLPMLQTASAADNAVADQAVLERDADFALNRIAARIRVTDPADMAAGKATSEWLKPAVYSVANGVLVEQQGKDSYVLAESVSGFDMSASSSEAGQPLIKVSLALARDGASTSAVTTVRLGSAQ